MDGIEITAADFATINTQDIAAVTILKDALATAQYGSRGANGVVVVTTRRGRAGKITASYSFNYGIQKVTKFNCRGQAYHATSIFS